MNLLDRWTSIVRRRRRIALTLHLLAPLPLLYALRAWEAPPHLLALLALLALFAIVLAERRRPKIDRRNTARHLAGLHPPLEESADLLLEDSARLTPLARLQKKRVEEIAKQLEPDLPHPVRAASFAALLAVAAAVVLQAGAAQRNAAEPIVEATSIPESLASEFQTPRLTLEIIPPEYTGRPPRTLQEFADAEVEIGSLVRWSADAAQAVIVFPHEETIDLPAERVLQETTVYRLVLDRREGETFASPWMRLIALPDDPPEIILREPAARTVLDGPRSIRVTAESRDDYGVGPTELVATLAAGSGEMVAFRDERFAFQRRTPIAGGMLFEITLDAEKLGMEPGTELYLRAEGFDRRRPQPQFARSSTHVVVLPGERREVAELSDGIPILPEATRLRSQRQIILDTETLIEERPRLTEDEVLRRANNLGADQRALRLRYGALLGEEFVSGRPAGLEDAEEGAEKGESEEEHDDHDHRHDHDHGHDHGRAQGEPPQDGTPESVEALIAGLMHVHDSDESDTFFPNEVRMTLKASLAAMWDAERRLRTAELDDALPFEYAALRELKKVQQASRVYVRRIGFDAPELRLENRLTGELDEILRIRRTLPEPTPRESLELRRVWRELREPSSDRDRVFDEAAAYLLDRARDEAIDLTIVDRLRSRETDEELREALWRLLPPPAQSPGRGADDGALHERYLDLLTTLQENAAESDAP